MADVREPVRRRRDAVLRAEPQRRPGERRGLPRRRRRRQRQDPRRPDGHQGPARDRRRRPRALGAGDEGRVPAVRGGRGQGVRGASAPGAGARPRRLHAPGVPRRAGRASGVLRAVRVHKRRVRYVVGGCTSEVSDVVVDGTPSRTIAIESEDAAAVVAAVASVGLRRATATSSYPQGPAGARSTASPRASRCIDVGTNSVKFHIGERRADGRLAAVVDRAEITRLGEGLDETGAISAGAARRARPRRSRAWSRRRERDGVAGDRRPSRRPGCGWPPTAARSSTAVRDRDRASRSRSSRARRRAGSRTSPSRPGWARPTVAGGLRHRRRQLAVHVRPRRHVDERFSVNVGAVRFTERFGLDGRSSG